MAPEIYQNEGHSFPSELFSLGVILHELLTSFRPFSPNSVKNHNKTTKRVSSQDNFGDEMADPVLMAWEAKFEDEVEASVPV